MTEEERNPVIVILNITGDDQKAGPFRRFCGVFPAQPPQLQYLFFRCLKAVSEGQFLVTTIRQDPPKADFDVRVHSSLILLSMDDGKATKKLGFLAN